MTNEDITTRIVDRIATLERRIAAAIGVLLVAVLATLITVIVK